MSTFDFQAAMAPQYHATLRHTPIGWAWTLRRDNTIIAQAQGILTLFFRTRAQALQAAAVHAQHDRERTNQRIPA